MCFVLCVQTKSKALISNSPDIKKDEAKDFPAFFFPTQLTPIDKELDFRQRGRTISNVNYKGKHQKHPVSNKKTGLVKTMTSTNAPTVSFFLIYRTFFSKFFSTLQTNPAYKLPKAEVQELPVACKQRWLPGGHMSCFNA